MAGEPASPNEHHALVLRYEQLRADALAGAGHGWRWGRAVLQHQGLAVWVSTWRHLTVAAPAPARPVPTVAVPAGSEQLVAVLAAMALAVTTTTGGCT